MTGRMGSEKLLQRHKEASFRVRDRDGTPAVCSILPSRKVRGMWHFRVNAVNCRLAGHCRVNEWTFVYDWDLF